MSFEDVTDKLQKMLDGGRLPEAEMRLAELAREAYEHRGELLVTFRCAISDDAGGRQCRRRAGHIFDSPNGLIFVDSSKVEGDGGSEKTLFLYDSGYLFISAPGVFGPAPILIAAAPFARCGRKGHGPFHIAAQPGTLGRDLRQILGNDYSKRGDITVYRALGGGPPINGATGQLGTDLGPLTRALHDGLGGLDDDPTLGYV